MPEPHPAEQFRSIAKIYQLVSEFLAPILMGLIVDWLAKTAPWGTMIGVVFGMLIGGYRIAKLSQLIGLPPKNAPSKSERKPPS